MTIMKTNNCQLYISRDISGQHEQLDNLLSNLKGSGIMSQQKLKRQCTKLTLKTLQNTTRRFLLR